MELKLQPGSEETWAAKYQLKDHLGNPLEHSVEDSFKRVAKALAATENDPEKWEREFYEALLRGATPGGRIVANAGSEDYKSSTSLINCVVSEIVEDTISGILTANSEAGITLSAGCGIGYEFSTLRPRGSYVKGAGAYTSGPLSFMNIFDAMCDTIASAGSRRGAQMATFAVWHPDVEEFIKAKRENGRLRKFNLSLLITDEFVEAVKNKQNFDLVFPVRQQEIEIGVVEKKDLVWKKRAWEVPYCEKQGYVLNSEKTEWLCKIHRTVNAEDLWNLIMQSTYDYAEPGFLLIDRINQYNNNYFCEEIRATNPSLVAGTLVHTKKGIFPIEQLDGKRFEVRARDGSWGPAECWKSGDAEKTITLKFNNYIETTATPKHKWPVLNRETGMIERRPTSEIQVGDLIPKNSAQLTEIEGNPDLTEDDGFFLGLWLADGTLTKRGDNGVLQFGFTFNKLDREDLAERILRYVNGIKPNESHLMERKSSLEFSFRDRGAVKYIQDKLNIREGKKVFPEIVWQSNDSFIKGFIDGFISGDGHVGSFNNTTSKLISLTQNNKEILVNFGKLLSFYGITSDISGGQRENPRFPNGKTYDRTYEVWRLRISTNSCYTFASLFSLTCTRKQERLAHLIDTVQAKTRRITVLNDYCSVKEVVENAELSPVWDVAVDHPEHLFPIQWCYTGNCGEQPLPPRGSCLLGSINLAKYVANPFTHDAHFLWDQFKKDVRVFTRMLDNVVESNGLPLEGQREEIFYKRRHGMGFMGLGSALSLLRQEYGSPWSIEFTEEVSKVLAVEGIKEGIELAIEKGPAPIFNDSTNGISNKKLWAESEYMKQIWEVCPELREAALKHGCRFTHHTSIAPTGTIAYSINNNVSNGIEPTFTHEYTRNIIKPGRKTKEAVKVQSYEFLLYSELTGKSKAPEEWSTTDNISPKAHVDIQAAAQKWIDSSISKTINVPTNTPFDEFKDIYMYAYDKGLKGCTTFRFNPETLQGVLVKEDDLNSTEYIFTLDTGEEITANGADLIEYEGETHSAQNLYDAIKEGYYGKL